MTDIKHPKPLDNQTSFVYKELQESIKKESKLSVVSADFSMYAYDKLKKYLDKIEIMRFIYTEPNFISNNEKEAREYYIDNNTIFGNELEIKLKNEMKQTAISKDFAQWINEKVEIKSMKTDIKTKPTVIYVDNDDDTSISITGSPEFTTAGLGLIKSKHPEMNMCTYGNTLTKSYLNQFETLWNDNDSLEDVKEYVLEQMKTMYKENPAEFLYFLSLYNIFSENLDALNEDNIIRKGNSLKETQIWNKLYKFQKDAVIGAIDKIENHNGCILADSVGLGKTFTALAIIKYYELRNDRVLVLVPKKLSENWNIYTQNDKRNIFIDDRFNYDVLYHTDLSRGSGESNGINLQTINWSNYDLVVIDESHNFRNNPAVKDRTTRYQKLMQEIIKEGHKTRLLMLSATPVNNKMTDIKNQIYFITEEDDKALCELGIDSIEATLRKAQRVFNQWTKLPENKRTSERFVDDVGLDYFKLLDTLTIARSRKHVEKYYDIDEIGRFPERRKPINIYSEIDIKGEFPKLEEINSTINKLNLGIYAPMEYVHRSKIEDYEKRYDIKTEKGATLRQIDKDRGIVQLMRVNLLKRMESSIESFRLTTKRLVDNIDNVLNKIENMEYIPDLDINLIDPEEEQYDEMIFGTKRKVLIQDLDPLKFRQDLELDKDKLKKLYAYSKEITPDRDKKLQDLKNQIVDKQKNPINNGNKKILIFSAFADTAKYLYNNINGWALKELGLYSALITGADDNKTNLKSIQNDFNQILTNFSPKSKERAHIYPEATDEIDILICTDCISEGQNLQDCDYLINYDIHWNPVRIIQRFGRIDRIGSENKEIQLVNFWPNMELDEYINLEGRVKDRMIMVNVTATGGEDIINEEEVNDLFYRKKQLEALQDKIIDLEDLSNSISITDLTFNDFKIELMDYMKENKLSLDKSPNGIYSIVNIPNDLKNEVVPGVIFLLKQVTGSIESLEKNPLSPYYLVYIGEDQEVKFSYMHSKKVMDYYKKLCLGNTEVLHDLVNEFDKETNNGRDMRKYSYLLIETIEDILGKKQEAGVRSLFYKGGTITSKQDIEGLEEFELITFLIVK